MSAALATRPAAALGAAVRLRGLSRAFSGRTVLKDISLDIAPGTFVALIGRSGCGKSTLLRAIAGLDDEAEGEGSIEAPENRSVLFQDSRLLPWESVLRNVMLGLRLPDAEARGRAALADVELAGRVDAWPGVLSGGEQQRVALARSLARQPALLLADEPFGALDALTRIRMHELLFRLVEIHRPTVLLVTHDVDEALLLADRVLVMEQGRIVLDRALGLAHPRRKTDPAFAAHRSTLLGALGVTESL
ncbi:MAG TPA: ABC transporter ATP-binding protein [Xanthobacteraceae bacterium]|nr:ABC transporter ATP-binding protein [Xanthobacteraceae bacterium]